MSQQETDIPFMDYRGVAIRVNEVTGRFSAIPLGHNKRTRTSMVLRDLKVTLDRVSQTPIEYIDNPFSS